MSEGGTLPRVRAYLINLDRSSERLSTMAGRLDALGLPWTRVPAIDGNSFGELPWPGYDHRAYDRNWGKSHHPNEVGCYLSHVRALQTFLAERSDFGLILEDDALFDADLGDVLDDLSDRADEWDVVKLGGHQAGMPMPVSELRHERKLVALLQRQTGAVAYLVNVRAARAYVAGLLPMSVPYDHAFDQVWRFGLRLRGIVPRPVKEEPVISTIGYDQGLGVKKPWYLRRDVALYRARTEIRRVLHYLFKDTRWMGYPLTPKNAGHR